MSHKQKNDTVYLVSGATGAIGKAIATKLALNKEAKVVLLCRNLEKGNLVAGQIASETNNDNVHYVLADISRQQQIRQLAQDWQGPLHVLINNAAITPRDRQETPEGIEMQFATNVLGYYWLIDAFTDILKNSSPARIINVASYWAGGLQWDDLQFKRRLYDNDQAYRQSKQANRMLSVAFANRLKAYGISVNACHPGDVNSKLSNALGFGGHETPEQAADTPVWLATQPIGLESNGKYYEHRRASVCRYSQDTQAVEKLFALCQAM